MTREQTHEIEIAVPAEVAWRALTDPDELVRWFVEDAAVEPGAGGRYWVSWGEGMEGAGRIDVWEPPRRLRVVRDMPEGDGPQLDAPLVEEWSVETRGGATIVRLVDAGFPDTDDWGGIYDSMELGWGLFLRCLRHCLERHPGRPRDSRNLFLRSPRASGEVWRAVTGPDGLALDGRLEAGGRYELATADGDVLRGEVVHVEDGRALQLTLEPVGDGLLTLAVEGDSDGTLAWGTVATFGDDDHPAADRLAARLDRLVAGE